MDGAPNTAMPPGENVNGQRLSRFRLMTYNIGGGRKDLGSQPDDIAQVIEQVSPDILAIQEAASCQDADGVWHSLLSQVAKAGAFGNNAHFAPALSMKEHMVVQKGLFVHGLFNDWQDWRQGNATLSRWEFVRLGDPSQSGTPRNVPLFRAPLYEGNRDTEPRYALLSRIKAPHLAPFVVGLHLTTLVGEREREGGAHPQPERLEAAQALRVQQAKRLLALLQDHVLARGEVVFLLGDFNAPASESCITSVLVDEGRFKRLNPTNDQEATHSEAIEPIDHILVYPGDRLIEYRCWIVDTPLAREASDHLPVVADVTVAS
jgi:endonuclease/exonuclease/phosphatase family metal-dependent hydrolase